MMKRERISTIPVKLYSHSGVLGVNYSITQMQYDIVVIEPASLLDSVHITFNEFQSLDEKL